MSVCQPIVGRCEVRVGINGLLEVLRRLPFFVVSGALTISVQVVIALKVCVQELSD